MDGFLLDLHLVTLHVDEKITDLDDFLLLLRHLHSVKDSFHSKDELPWAEGLCDVVIRTQFKSYDSINFFRFRREHEDRDRRRCGLDLRDRQISLPSIPGSMRSRMISPGRSFLRAKFNPVGPS